MITELNAIEFMGLKTGSNIVRIISKPFKYKAHRIDNIAKKCTTNCALCSEHGQVGSDLHHELLTQKQQSRWIMGVIDRREEDIKIVDFSVPIYYFIHQLSRNEDWGNPRNYDIDIRVNPDKGEYEIHNIRPRSIKPLTKSDEDLLSIFTKLGYQQLMKNFCHTNDRKHDRDWHMRDEVEIITYGATCNSCLQHYPYALKSDGFKCWPCRNNW